MSTLAWIMVVAGASFLSAAPFWFILGSRWGYLRGEDAERNKWARR